MGLVDTEIRHEEGLARVYGYDNDVFVTLDGISKRIDQTGLSPKSTVTDGAVYKAGATGARIESSAANQSMIRSVFEFNHDGGYGVYTRSYVATAGISADAFRAFGTVENVAAATARGAHISLSFGASGTVTGLAAALEATLHVPSGGGMAGTNYAVKAAINSDGEASDPAGATHLAYFAAVNQGDATGGADVDDDAVLFHIDGHTIADDNMVDSAATEYALSEITHGIKIKVGSTVMWLLASTTNPKST